MIPLFTRDEARAMDLDASTRLGIASRELMENAGVGATHVLLQRYAGHFDRVWVVGGVGQNGGDAWVVVRALMKHGINPHVVLVGAREKISGDAKPNFDALVGLGISVIDVRVDADVSRVREGLLSATLIVDGLFGTGLDRAITGPHLGIISLINDAGAPVVSLDVPSGIDSDTGAIHSIAVNASLTTTFGVHKRGLHQAPARAFAGEIVCVEIGTEPPAPFKHTLVDAASVSHALPTRAPDAHKGTAGRVLVIAGSEGHSGAAMLSGLGALRAGAGLVTLAPRPSAFHAIEAKVFEMMTVRIAHEPRVALGELVAHAAKADAVVLGPGFGVDDEAREMLRELAVSIEVPTVIDADALTALGTDLAFLAKASAPRVLTPHPGEAARVLGTTIDHVQRDRYESACELARRAQQVTILKGACSVIAAPNDMTAVCDRGTPALAVGGTGDVLAGCIGAMLVHLDAFDAAWCATWLHAVAGELAAISDRGLLAREVADALPRALGAARKAG